MGEIISDLAKAFTENVLIRGAKFITSWYIAPLWAFGFAYAMGEPIWFCAGLSFISGYVAYRIWE